MYHLVLVYCLHMHGFVLHVVRMPLPTEVHSASEEAVIFCIPVSHTDVVDTLNQVVSQSLASTFRASWSVLF